MKILIDLPEKSVAALLMQAEKQGCSIDELISMKVERKEQPTFQEEWSDAQVEDLMEPMYEGALANCASATYFTAMHAFIKSFNDESWSTLAPSTRKKIGRRFRAYVDEIGEDDKQLFIKAAGKTPTNSITYSICRKAGNLFGINK